MKIQKLTKSIFVTLITFSLLSPLATAQSNNECNDTHDNDGDGKADFPNDAQCTAKDVIIPEVGLCPNGDKGKLYFEYVKPSNLGAGNGAGIMLNMTAKYYPASQEVSIMTEWIPNTSGYLPQMLLGAFNYGPNPKGIDGELAFFYWDLVKNVFVVYGYSGANSFGSWKDGSFAPGIQPPDRIISSLIDNSFIKELTYDLSNLSSVKIGFRIDATKINEHKPLYPDAGGNEYLGMKWGNPLIQPDKTKPAFPAMGMWFHAMYGIQSAYDNTNYLSNLTFQNSDWRSGIDSNNFAVKAKLECKPECSDEKDNDGDGLTDKQDPGCSDPEDPSEKNECTAGQTKVLNCTPKTNAAGECSKGTKTLNCRKDLTWEDEDDTRCKPNSPIDEVLKAGNCSDSLDNDCDGSTDLADSGCGVCTPGDDERKTCDTGLMGLCSNGFQQRSCSNQGQWSEWSACKPNISVGQVPEIINTQCKDPKTNQITPCCSNNVDDDCDGTTDNSDTSCQECSPGATTARETCSVSNTKGVCIPGFKFKVCQPDGFYGDYLPCQSIIKPGEQLENCTDGLDNDCDGFTDLNVGSQDNDCFSCNPGDEKKEACLSGLPGLCASGTRIDKCDGTQWEQGTCDPNNLPGGVKENCSNAQDDDCDGLIDLADPDCSDCNTINTSEYNTILDASVKALARRVKSLTKEYKKLTNNKADKKWVNKTSLSAYNLGQAAWVNAWELPIELVTCNNFDTCTVSSSANKKAEYTDKLNKINQLKESVVKRLKKFGKLSKPAQLKLKEYKKFEQAILSTLPNVPESYVSCQEVSIL